MGQRCRASRSVALSGSGFSANALRLDVCLPPDVEALLPHAVDVLRRNGISHAALFG